MRTNAASVRPIDGQAAKALPRMRSTASRARSQTSSRSQLTVFCCLASAAQRALEMEQEYADVSDR